MPTLTPEQIESRVDATHPVVPLTYPPRGMQPYYAWLVSALHELAEASAGPLRVVRATAWDPTAPVTAVRIAPGRASIDGAPISLESTTLDLAPHNNTTVLIYLDSNAQPHTLNVDSDALAEPCLRLAEVTLAAGAITTITDRRFETMLRV